MTEDQEEQAFIFGFIMGFGSGFYLIIQQDKEAKIFGVIVNESNSISPKIKSICRINPYNIEEIFKGCNQKIKPAFQDIKKIKTY